MLSNAQISKNKQVWEARRCFLENVSESCYDWRAAFNSYANYIETLNNHCKEDTKELVYEIRCCSELLERKRIDPKSIATGFVLHKEYLR